MSTYEKLLQEQIRNEFTASQQYLAVAVWYDSQDLPRLASHFYKQALEERNHAMMMVQYLLERDIQPQMEITVTKQIETLARTARDESDYIGEQFMQWFLKEQVEEVATMNTLVNVAKRAGDNLFNLEDFIAREGVGDDGAEDPTAPPVAGGKV